MDVNKEETTILFEICDDIQCASIFVCTYWKICIAFLPNVEPDHWSLYIMDLLKGNQIYTYNVNSDQILLSTFLGKYSKNRNHEVTNL